MAHKYVDGVAIELTPQEIIARAAEEAVNAAQVIVPQVVTARQFLATAAIAGIITDEEAISGEMPASILAALSGLSAEELLVAKVTWSRMTTISRNDPLLAAVAVALSITSEELDNLFIQAGAI